LAEGKQQAGILISDFKPGMRINLSILSYPTPARLRKGTSILENN
jgi:hypothetical protein